MDNGQVNGLGILSPQGRDAFVLDKVELKLMAGSVDSAIRPQVAEYLRNATMVLPLMGYSRDVVGNRFGVTGGTAVMTDGVFYWRRDAAEYVDVYGIRIDEAALGHMRAQNWRPPVLTSARERSIEAYLLELLEFIRGGRGK